MTVSTDTDLGVALVDALDVAALHDLGLVGGVHDTIVPPDTPRPYLKFQVIDAGDEQTIGVHCYTMWLVNVQVVSPDRAMNNAIYAAAHAILERGALASLTGHDITYRQRPLNLPNVGDDGVTYWANGGQYRIGVRQS